MRDYQETFTECKKRIKGVCSHCGGTLYPIETVDNARRPTFWGGCKSCMMFDYGVDKKIFEISKDLVLSGVWRIMPSDQSECEKDYWIKTETSRACRVVLFISKRLKEIS